MANRLENLGWLSYQHGFSWLYLIDIGVFMLTFLEKETKKDPLDIKIDYICVVIRTNYME